MAEGEGEHGVEAADDLYAVPLDRFVAERDALAKRLRHDGEKEPAAAVRKLRKPSVPAAAVNSAVRSRPKLAKAVVDAGERLGAAQHAALAGEASDLRAAMTAEGEAIEDLVGVIVSETELSAVMIDRARDTIRAAGRDGDLRAAFLAGRMDRDAEAIGFGGGLVEADPPRRRAGDKNRHQPERSGSRSKPGPSSQGAERPKPSTRERRRAEQRVRRAEKALEAAEGAADDARSAAGKVAEEASEADDAVATARTQLGRAERDQAKAAKKLETAQSQLESAEEERETRATELAEARAEAEQN